MIFLFNINYNNMDFLKFKNSKLFNIEKENKTIKEYNFKRKLSKLKKRIKSKKKRIKYYKEHNMFYKNNK